VKYKIRRTQLDAKDPKNTKKRSHFYEDLTHLICREDKHKSL
jgi:hypothetical protein